MNELFLIVAHNHRAALALACIVWSVTRVWRNPAAAHLLWLVVLLKLLAPPVMHVDWSSVLPTAWRGSNHLAVAGLSDNRIAKTGTDSRPLGAEAATAEPVRKDHRPGVEGSPGQIPHAPSVPPSPNGFADDCARIGMSSRAFFSGFGWGAPWSPRSSRGGELHVSIPC